MICRKLIAVVVIVTLTVAGFGCRKKPQGSAPQASEPPAQPQKVEVKTQAEYNEMAKKEITSENMQAELDKIEKEVQQESGGGL